MASAIASIGNRASNVAVAGTAGHWRRSRTEARAEVKYLELIDRQEQILDIEISGAGQGNGPRRIVDLNHRGAVGRVGRQNGAGSATQRRSRAAKAEFVPDIGE